MRVAPLLFSLAGLGAAAQKTPRLSPKASAPGSQSLVTRQSCSTSETGCDSFFCIPDDAECCLDGIGTYCASGTYCVTGGCCDDGDTCDDSYYNAGDSCSDSDKVCGGLYCIPKDAVCCEETGLYCDAGETCTSDGWLCTDDTVNLCTRKSRGGGGGGFGSDDEEDDSGDGCDDSPAAGLAAPVILAGVAAALPVLL